MPGFQPIYGGVAPQQRVAVVLPNAIKGEFFFRIPGIVVGKIPDGRGTEGYDIPAVV